MILTAMLVVPFAGALLTLFAPGGASPGSPGWPGCTACSSRR